MIDYVLKNVNASTAITVLIVESCVKCTEQIVQFKTTIKNIFSYFVFL